MFVNFATFGGGLRRGDELSGFDARTSGATIELSVGYGEGSTGAKTRSRVERGAVLQLFAHEGPNRPFGAGFVLHV